MTKTETKIPTFEIREVGFVKEIKRGIARVDGLPSCAYGQWVQFAQGAKGFVMGFNPTEALLIVLGEEGMVSVGERVISAAEVLTVPVGAGFLGRIVNCLAEPMDGKGEISSSDSDFSPVFREAPGVMEREPITEALQTGTKILDLTIPIGKGQRELIIGDRQVGKSSLALDAFLNQQNKNVFCIYCWIGGPQFALKKIINTLIEKKALGYTIVVAATANSPSAEQYLVPYTAATLGEYFMEKGKDVLVVFDDLTKHAWVYRQISLLMEQSPGREAYPGDIFYLHSQLMERAGKLKRERGGGSMTFLPIAETLQGDISGYIQTNLISMTDGQIYLSSHLFREGFKPAIDLGLSVSRIGSKVQSPAIKEVGQGLRLEFARYREMLKLTKLKVHLSDEMMGQMTRGEVLRELLVQPKNEPVSLEEQAALFYTFRCEVLEKVPPSALKKFREGFFHYLVTEESQVITHLKERRELTEDIKKELDRAIVAFFKKMEFQQEDYD